MTCYIVLLCGCTDCFPNAAFWERDKAEQWARTNSKNPEGFIIKEYPNMIESENANVAFLRAWTDLN